MKIDDWLDMLKNRFTVIGQWILNGSLKVYDGNLLMNKDLFISLLKAYFIRKVNDDKTSPEKVKLIFKFTKAFKEEDLTQEMIDLLAKKNNNKEMIFLSGLVIKGGKYDTEKQVITESENVDDIRKPQKCPIVCISYEIEEYEEEGEEEEQEEEESEEDEDKEEVKEVKAKGVKQQQQQPEEEQGELKGKVEDEPDEEKGKENENEKQEEEVEEDEEEYQTVMIPFFENEDMLNMNNYLMRVPYGFFTINIDKNCGDNSELIFKARSMNILFEN